MLWYLAHPYSNDPIGNVERVNAIAARLFNLGFHFYSPISMSHPIHEKAHALGLYEGEMWEEWMQFDQEMITRCDGLILCPGWETSDGCKRERLYFLNAHKPIEMLAHFLDDKRAEAGEEHDTTKYDRWIAKQEKEVE